VAVILLILSLPLFEMIVGPLRVLMSSPLTSLETNGLVVVFGWTDFSLKYPNFPSRFPHRPRGIHSEDLLLPLGPENGLSGLFDRGSNEVYLCFSPLTASASLIVSYPASSLVTRLLLNVRPFYPRDLPTLPLCHPPFPLES